MTEPAIPAGHDPRRHAYQLAVERNRVLSGEPPLEPRILRDIIRADWRHMRRDRVRPDGVDALFLDEREIAELRHRPDLDLAWRMLCHKVLDTDHMIVLGDERARVIRRAGAGTILSTSDDGGFGDGAEMLTRGTNGMRLAVLTGRGVQIYGPEHWLHTETRWTCTAVPVRDPDLDRIIAVINVTAPWHTVHPHTLLMLTGVAERIADALAASTDRADWDRIRTAAGPLPRWGRPVIVATRDGVVLDAYAWPEFSPGRVISGLGHAEPGPACLRALGWCDLEPLPHGGWLISRPHGDQPSIRVTLDRTTPARSRLIVRGPAVFWPIVELRPLHARILELLAERGAATAAELTVHLYGARSTTSAAPEMTKLRRDLGSLFAPHVPGGSHRFADHVVVDVASGP